jgi:hypothetical protein
MKLALELKIAPKVYDRPGTSKWADFYYLDMPRFVQNQQRPYALFEIPKGVIPLDTLSKTLNQKLTDKTKSVWYPAKARGLGDWAWVDDNGPQPRCPIYIISKGRPQCITARALTKMGLYFLIVVEPSELSLYQDVWGDRVITGGFDTTTSSSIPVRNWVDDHCPDSRYWLMDDNIEDFNLLTDNQKYTCRSSAIFRATEDFTDRFSNIGQAGFNYYSFAKKTEAVPPYYLNTRIYSCTLMYKHINGVRVGGSMWRGRYNEDTDLSLRILKAGYCTVLMNTFLAGKITTQRVKGGNTDSVYTDGDERLTFARSLEEQHPDCVKVVRRFNRWHHKVDYSGFTQKPKLISYIPTDYKMRLDDKARAREE